MRINKIELLNFGSYEGENAFDVAIKDNEKNIVIIGGKNGAGKTTLFTAIKLCIYGSIAYGYQSANSFYNRQIIKLINNTAKLVKPSISFVKVSLSINNGLGYDDYIIQRTWSLMESPSLVEKLEVQKNNTVLSEDEAVDFQKYVNQLIPPELFNLYFFDGEKIADFFLNEGGNSRIKKAFMTLCGYDTFDLMSRNFKRISNNSDSNSVFSQYLSDKENLENVNNKINSLIQEISICEFEIEKIDAEIAVLDQEYQMNGGVSQSEWNHKFTEIKKEESRREELNAWLKKMANDTIPFLIIKKELFALKKQINNEKESTASLIFAQRISDSHTYDLLSRGNEELNIHISPEKLHQLINYISNQLSNSINEDLDYILRLSPDEQATVLSLIDRVMSFEMPSIGAKIKQINESKKRSQRIRAELEKCNIDFVNTYVRSKNDNLKLKDLLIERRNTLEHELKKFEIDLVTTQAMLVKSQKKFEEELKKNSINDIASRAILMLDKLQSDLYRSQIEKVEYMFRKSINILMRKSNFIDDIAIDDDFNVRVYRFGTYSGKDLFGLITQLGRKGISETIGDRALKIIEEKYDVQNIQRKVETSSEVHMEDLILPIELDKTCFSNGEKQIFIMALYMSLIHLCQYEVPFVIDTPFARIDTEHRQNIAEHFFKELKGQVFILSTNEEIETEHINILNEKILTTYMLENLDNKRTVINSGQYFDEVIL